MYIFCKYSDLMIICIKSWNVFVFYELSILSVVPFLRPNLSSEWSDHIGRNITLWRPAKTKFHTLAAMHVRVN
jgi:hypothetical protein